jgi:arylsulfatase A-like enzyme
MSFRWSDERNQSGVAGSIASIGLGEVNRGTHGTLSPFDIHNTFIAAGPDFRRGINSDLPTSNLDVAATIAHVLALDPPKPLDGRIVTEAMTGNTGDSAAGETKTAEASRDFPSGKWRQYLRTSTVGSSTYFDEGNGRWEQK